MNDLLKLFLSKTDKGRDINRSAILTLLAFVAWQVTDLRERVVRIETRLSMSQTVSNAAPVSADSRQLETISVDEIVAAALQGMQDGILAQKAAVLQAVNESRARSGQEPLTE